MFQHTAARRRLLRIPIVGTVLGKFQHTAARRRLRDVAASHRGATSFQHTAARRRLPYPAAPPRAIRCFNTQPPEGGCLGCGQVGARTVVSTHSRPKAAAPPARYRQPARLVSTHSRPKAAAGKTKYAVGKLQVSTHSRPKAAAGARSRRGRLKCCFNTQPPEGGCAPQKVPTHQREGVSTHSRPKAAAYSRGQVHSVISLFQHTAARRRLPRRKLTA